MRLLPLLNCEGDDLAHYVNPELILSVGEYMLYRNSPKARVITGIWMSAGDEPTIVSYEPLESFLRRLTQHEEGYGTVSASDRERQLIDEFWSQFSNEGSTVTTLVRLPKGEWKLCGKVLSISVNSSDIPLPYQVSSYNVFYSSNRYMI